MCCSGTAQSSEDLGLGQPLRYDPDFKGPLKNRSCTDIICLLLFVVFLVCWGGVGWYAITRGDPYTLLTPRDSQGQKCGLDEAVKTKKYLFFFDLTKCFDPLTPFTGCKTTQVCVETCPDSNFFSASTNNSDKNAATSYCEYDIQESKIFDSKKCPTWYIKSESLQYRCIPNLSAAQTVIDKIAEAIQNSSDKTMSILTQSIQNVKLLSQAEEVAENVVQDIMVSWWKILIGVVAALLSCIIYILILRWIAAPMVWLSILGVVAGLTAGTYFATIQYIDNRDKYNQRGVNELYYDEQASLKLKRDLWLTGLIILATLLGIILLVLIFLRKRIYLAIQLIKEASRAVSSVTSSLFFPIFPWVLQVGVIAYAICVGMYLATTGNAVYIMRNVDDECNKISEGKIKFGNICTPGRNFSDLISTWSACANATCRFSHIENEKLYYYLQGINVFGFFWLAFFVSAMGQMVLAQVFAQWYWTFKKTNLPFFAVTSAAYRTLRYHIGTLAFGSLIITICRLIRLALEYVDRKLKKYDNELTKAILCCCKCFFWLLEKFLKFINKNAYIMCAIHGKSFCASARDAFMLLMRNIIRVLVLDKVTDFLFFLSKVLVTLGVGAVAYVFFASDLLPTSVIDNSSLKYGGVPVAIIMIATYLIATLFFNVYSMAVDTLFLCFLEDCERNDGSPEKPYFMSKRLMGIFGKKNKIKQY